MFIDASQFREPCHFGKRWYSEYSVGRMARTVGYPCFAKSIDGRLWHHVFDAKPNSPPEFWNSVYRRLGSIDTITLWLGHGASSFFSIPVSTWRRVSADVPDFGG